MPTNNYAARLPDTYAKETGSVNERLLRLHRDFLQEGYNDVEDTGNAAGLEQAYGATLDLYGGMVGQPRGDLDDTRYRYLIRNKIARNFVVGDYESVLDGIVAMFEADKNTIVLDDHPKNPGVVYITKLPFSVLSAAGFTATQAMEMIERLVPVGVRVEGDNFEGTFEFAETQTEQNQNAGFSDHPASEQQTMGGYFGFAIGENESSPLPIV